MHFSAKGHEVVAVDDYFRRRASIELDCESLIPCPNLKRRAKLWKDLTGRDIEVRIGDITEYGFLARVMEAFRPDAVVHYAEQPSAPYSMINRDAAAFTVRNNLIGTLNIVYAVKEFSPECHIIKLGTMGEYGTPNIDIEEGWLDVEHKGRKDKFLFPRQASSLYHTTKIQDTDLLWFYVRTWGLRVTDLMQGPVYGISSDESAVSGDLMTSFHYDEVFGTVLNRFVVQAAAGHPLTVYGKGNQVRGYLNLKDTLACVYLAAEKPAGPGDLRIFNQITETFSVNQLAEKVKRVGQQMGFKVSIQNIRNPRVEKEDHYYSPKYTGLIELGLTPHYLTDDVLGEMFKVVEKYSQNINVSSIFKGISWK
jgi:UDP-sulfoquinovose synthase